MTEPAPTRFLLYIDILGFSEMTKSDPRSVARTYAILNKLNVHRDKAFKTIVFSDTVLVYNPVEARNDEDRNFYVSYLTEAAEDLYSRLVGQDIWFRAVLIAGEFNHYQLENLDAFYGKALIDAYLPPNADAPRTVSSGESAHYMGFPCSPISGHGCGSRRQRLQLGSFGTTGNMGYCGECPRRQYPAQQTGRCWFADVCEHHSAAAKKAGQGDFLKSVDGGSESATSSSCRRVLIVCRLLAPP